jgi:transposase
VIRKRAPGAKRAVFETGPLSVWFFHALTDEGMPAICIDARHAKAALDMAANKTDANDADGLAHLAEVGFYKEVRVKSFDSMLARTLVAARTRLVRIGTELSNQIRGLMKTFGLIVPPCTGGKFERNVEALLADNAALRCGSRAASMSPDGQLWSGKAAGSSRKPSMAPSVCRAAIVIRPSRTAWRCSIPKLLTCRRTCSAASSVQRSPRCSCSAN